MNIKNLFIIGISENREGDFCFVDNDLNQWKRYLTKNIHFITPIGYKESYAFKSIIQHLNINEEKVVIQEIDIFTLLDDHKPREVYDDIVCDLIYHIDEQLSIDQKSLIFFKNIPSEEHKTKIVFLPTFLVGSLIKGYYYYHWDNIYPDFPCKIGEVIVVENNNDVPIVIKRSKYPIIKNIKECSFKTNV
ncbi:TPA: hypothetical protein DEP21_02690 [Patescibacteria group bacterium]|nr:hypothetical protein [Candidatus Gracilibacteria bacterium]